MPHRCLPQSVGDLIFLRSHICMTKIQSDKGKGLGGGGGGVGGEMVN